MATEITPRSARAGDLVCDADCILFTVERISTSGSLWVKTDCGLGDPALTWGFRGPDLEGDYLFVFRPLRAEIQKRFNYRIAGDSLKIIRV